MPDPTIAQLEVFEAALRTGSVSAAARELGLTQQAASLTLRSLERGAGLELVHRSTQGVSPRPEGEAVLVAAQEVLRAVHGLRRTIRQLRGVPEPAPAVAVAASQTIAAHLLPRWILELRRTQEAQGCRPAEIDLWAANSEGVIAAVREGRVQLGFVETPELPPDLSCELVLTDRMVVAVSPGHPWAGREAVDLEELSRTPLVVREDGSGTRAALDRAVRTVVGRVPRLPAAVFSTEAAVRSAVAAGVGPAVLSRMTIDDDVRLGRLRAVPIRPDLVHRPFTAVWRGRAHELDGTCRELVELATQEETRDAAQP